MTAGMDEETITASLMGNLTSCLTWYALAARMSGEENGANRQCDVYWAHQQRHVERWRGADFGLARRVSTDGNLRISLYQAKVVKIGEKADLFRRVHERNRSAADRDLNDLLDNKSLSYPIAKNIHQIHKLYSTRCAGLINCGTEINGRLDKPEWVRYVFWSTPEASGRPLPAPSIRSVVALLKEIKRNRKIKSRDFRFYSSDFFVCPMPNREITEYEFDFDQDFITLASDNGTNDLIVSVDEARKLMGELAKIGIPDFLAVDEAGGAEGAALWEYVFDLTRLNVTYKTGTRDLGPVLSRAPTSIVEGKFSEP